MVPVYTAVTLLQACGGQLSSILKSGRAAQMSEVVAKGLQPHKVNLPVYTLHILLGYVSQKRHTVVSLLRNLFLRCSTKSYYVFLPRSCSWFQEVWSFLYLPPMDALPPAHPDNGSLEGPASVEEWPLLLSPLLYILGAAVAYWGSALFRLLMRLISLLLAPFHRCGWTFKHGGVWFECLIQHDVSVNLLFPRRPSVSRDCGTLQLRTQLLITLCLTVTGAVSCGALAIFAAFLLHLYRVSPRKTCS